MIDTDGRNRVAVNAWAEGQTVEWAEDGSYEILDRLESFTFPDGEVVYGDDIPDWFRVKGAIKNVGTGQGSL